MPVFSGGFDGPKTIQSLDTELKQLKIRTQTIKSYEFEPRCPSPGTIIHSIHQNIQLHFDSVSCISAWHGRDFKRQPDIVNRNFIDHGMLHRNVTKRDRIQIFLLYYNLLEILDIVYPETSNKGT